MARMDVETRVEDGIVVITPRGELDVAGAPLLEDAIAAATDDPDIDALVVDLSPLEFMDSSGLRCVVQADRQVRERGIRFALVRGGEPVHRVFEITRMTDRLTWVDSPGDLQSGAEERT
jgi:anti-sigma B factor antagonist